MQKNKKLLITGASGFLGWNLVEAASSNWDVYGVYNSNTVIPTCMAGIRQDITHPGEMKKLFMQIQPDAVIHTAAASNPNHCQKHPEETRKINVDASVHIAELCAAHAIPLVFTSTDLVFNGLNPPYAETSPVTPVCVYSEQKVLAEENMMRIYPQTTICRMPLMFGYSGSCHQSFTKEMIMALINGKPLNLFSDEYRTPVDARSASAGLLLFLLKPTEIIHLGGYTRISRYDMGLVLANLLKCDPALIRSARQKDHPMPAPRPADVSLDSSKAFSMGYHPDALETALKKTLKPTLE